MELQMAFWLGLAMAIRISSLRQEMLKKADVETYGWPDAGIDIYAALNIQHLENGTDPVLF
jgi:hypothetical protein